MCEFAERSRDGVQLLCSITTRPCIYRKYCKKTGTFIHLDEWSECYVRNENLKKDIPEGSQYVRFERKGYLYVELGGEVVKIENTLKEKVDNFVYVHEFSDGRRILSLTPFKPEEVIEVTNNEPEPQHEIEQHLVEVIETPKPKKKRTKKTTKKENEDN